MPLISVYFLVLGLINEIKCEFSLQIIKNVEDFYTPISSVVEEKVGANFSLLCELVSSKNDNTHFDDQISWGKETANLTFENEATLKALAESKHKLLQTFLRPSEVNKAVRRFDPLQQKDGGKYFCMSLKHMLFKVVQVYVKNDKPKRAEVAGTTFYSAFCNPNMFKCHSYVICIPKHYVCDGKPDCKDQSDESWEICDGDPCRDKLQCDDGRCIPISWCCDRHHDLNCTVVNRPSCCQLLSEPYEEMEYGYVVPFSIHPVKSNGGRYLFISVCVLSTCFSVLLLLLILSKVVIFAKKSAYLQTRNNLEEISLHQRIPVNRNDIRGYRNYRSSRDIVVENNEISNPLLVPCRASCQPPSYADVVGNPVTFITSPVNVSEPPPPYTSQEVLNIAEDRYI